MKMERGGHIGYRRQLVATLLAAGLVTCTAQAAPARAQPSATITSSLSPDRPGARGALTFAIHYAGGELGVPSPVRKTVLQFPAGLTLDIPSLRSCTPARLLALGPSDCPSQSEIGRGHALAEAPTGSQLIVEEVTLWAFVGPPQNNRPTLVLFGEGSTPIPAEVVVTGTVLPDRPPYGEEFVIPIPPIPTLPSEPDASMTSLSLTIGRSRTRRRHNANSVVVPPRCPAGGFPFAAAFTYADGSTASAFTTAPCAR
jgi:hypothetical protein